MKSYLADAVFAILIGACAAPSQRIVIPDNHAGDLVQLSAVVRPSPFGVLAGEAFCSVKSVDGSKGALEYFFVPGTHTVRLWLTNMGHSYEGDIQVTFATTGKYEFFVKRRENQFDVSTRQIPDGELVVAATVKATSFVPVIVPIPSK